MTQLLVNFAATFDDDIQTRLFDGLGEVPDVWRRYFNVEATSKFVNSTTGYSGFGAMPEWQDGTSLPMDEAVKIFDNVITQVSYGMGFKASRNHAKYGDIALILRWAAALGRGLGQTYGSVHADVLNNAFTTTHASLGSVALISASHTSSGAATRSNINASAALTPANLEVLIVQGMNHQNFRGLNDPIMYNKLITVPAMRRTAVKILQSNGEPFVNDNDINTQQGMFELVIEPFASDSTTHYFLQASTHGLMSLHGQTPRSNSYLEQSSESQVYQLSADFATGVEFWEGMAASQGA